MSALIQQSDEWFALRRNHIGASDAPIIMGVSPWKTSYQLWEEKLGFRKNNTTAAMQRGLDMEDEARREFEKVTGLIVFPEVVFHPEKEWMMASLDGIDIEHRNIVEIKCPGKQDHESAMDGVIPSKYYPQLQHQLAVTGLDKGFYFSYDGNSSVVLTIVKDSKYMSTMISREQEFWRCLTELEAPDLTDKDYVDRQDDIWNQTASKWLTVQHRLEKLKNEEDELRKMLICMSGKSNSKGAGIKLSRIVRRGSIDYKVIPELENVDLEKYRKEAIETWRIGKV